METHNKQETNSDELFAIFDNAAVVLILVDEQRRIININKTGIETVGIKKGDILGQVAGQLLDCVNAWNGSNVVCGTTEQCKNCTIKNPITNSFVTGRNHYKEPGVLTVNREGKLNHLELLVSTSVVKVHGISYVLLTIDDITKMKVQERELKKVNDDKDKFISILSHDLRSPFGLFMGLAEVLKDNLKEFDNNQIEEVVNELSDAANSSYTLLDDLLSWAKSQLGSMNFEPKTVFISDEFEKVYDNQKHNAALKGISIVFNEKEPTSVFADDNMLRTLLRNLISNAIKFTPNDGKITVSCENIENGTIISVSDNGVGIPKAKLTHMFDESNFESTKGTNGEKGSGFGLLLCKEFVEKHQGDIKVESVIGEGTSFIINFPKAM